MVRPNQPNMPREGLRSGKLTDAAFRFVTGHRGAAPSGEGGLRGLLTTAFGPSRRDPTRPDLNAASKALGLSPRQLRRWVSGEVRRPNPQAVQALTKAARQAASTRRGRERSVKAAKAAGGAKRPSRRRALRVSGVQGVFSSNDDQYRDRTTVVDLTDDQYGQLQDAWIQGGNEGAMDWLHDHYDNEYQYGWHFQSVDDIDWDNR